MTISSTVRWEFKFEKVANFVIVIPACGANSENISVVIKAVVWGKVPFGIMLALSFA